ERAFEIKLEFVEPSVPPPSVTAPVPRAVLLLALSVPAAIVVPPEYVLSPERLVVPVPVWYTEPVPETTPDSLTTPLPLRFTLLPPVASVPVRLSAELVLFSSTMPTSALRLELTVWTAVPFVWVTTIPEVPVTPSLLNSRLPLLSV